MVGERTIPNKEDKIAKKKCSFKVSSFTNAIDSSKKILTEDNYN